jgi:hypothetical protein
LNSAYNSGIFRREGEDCRKRRAVEEVEIGPFNER